MNILKKKSFWIILGALIAVFFLVVFLIGLKNGNYETVFAEKNDLVKVIEISGEVVPAEEVELSFAASGDVIEILKDVGDRVYAGQVLARINSNQVSSEISEAQANLESAKARLQEIEGGQNSEIRIRKSNLVKTLKKAYVSSDGIVKNQTDTFFENPGGRYPEFNNTFTDYGPNLELGEARYEIGKMLDEWKKYNDNLNENNFTYEAVNIFVNNLNELENFLSLIASYSYEFEPTNDVNQTQIDSYVSNISSSRTTVSNLLVDINNSLDNLRDVEAEVPIQSATIKNNSATVERLYSKADDYVLRAPFDGVITENSLELGQYVSSSDVAFVLISDSPLEIEVYIPEINIVGVDVGDEVHLMFDALQDVEIEAVVTHIDPKETIKDGVVTYRSLIDLISPNDNLRPGMSADAMIQKEIITDQLIVPTYTIIKEGDESFVKVKKDSEIEKVKIEILDKDNRGMVSVSGNIKEGDEIIILKEE